MEDSILTSVKSVVRLTERENAFDPEVIMHINASLAEVGQLGISPIFIEDKEALWSDLEIPSDQLNLLKTYVYLNVRLLFDPPDAGFLVTSMQNQRDKYEWRLRVMRDDELALET